MPETSDYYLFRLANDIGMANFEVGGAKPLSWTDILSFSTLTGRRLSSFEARAIWSISQEYVLWIMKGRDKRCQPPFYQDNRSIEQMREEVANKIKARRKND